MNLFKVKLGFPVSYLARFHLLIHSREAGHIAIKDDLLEFTGQAATIFANKNVLWAHGASIGEVKCILPIVEFFINEQLCDKVLLTYTSPDGLGEIKRWQNKSYSKIITCPLPHVMVSVLCQSLSSSILRLCVIAENDIWPRILWIAERHKAPVLVIDAHLGYCKTRVLWYVKKRFYSLRAKRLTAVCVATKKEHENMSHQVNEKQFFLTGPSKAIESITRSRERDKLRSKYIRLLSLGNRQPILIMGSWIEREAGFAARLCREFLREYPVSSVIIAPRHIRKPKVMRRFKRELSKQKLQHSTLTSSLQLVQPGEAQSLRVILVDEMGYLASLYAIADVAIIGGSFIGSGGHNFFEPVAMRVPTICGSDLGNWVGVYEPFVREGCVIRTDRHELFHRIREVLAKPQLAAIKSELAYEILKDLASRAEQNIRIATDLAKGIY